MNRRIIVRGLGGFALAASIVAAIVMVRFPNKSECVASGRTVDPTERHCLSPAGFEQLQEHVTFHVLDAVVMGAGLIVVLVAVRYIVRKARRAA